MADIQLATGHMTALGWTQAPVRETLPRDVHALCPRCALVISPGQMNAHLTTCSGVT